MLINYPVTQWNIIEHLRLGLSSPTLVSLKTTLRKLQNSLQSMIELQKNFKWANILLYCPGIHEHVAKYENLSGMDGYILIEGIDCSYFQEGKEIGSRKKKKNF